MGREVLMAKTCNLCREKITVDQGNYVNFYPPADKTNPIAWKMESYHLKCFIRKSSGGGF
jgi:hypothetical protein